MLNLIKHGNDFWKFNSSLVYDAVYVANMKNHYRNQLFKRIYGKRPNKMEIFKIRNSNIHYYLLKNHCQKMGKQRIILELKLTNLESNLNSAENRKLYNHSKNDLETIYDYNTDVIKIRSKENGMARSLKSSF